MVGLQCSEGACCDVEALVQPEIAHPSRFGVLGVKQAVKAAPKVERVPARLTVLIERATQLPVADSDGTSDPYVEATCGSEKRRTSVVKKSLDPEWGELLEFEGRIDGR